MLVSPYESTERTLPPIRRLVSAELPIDAPRTNEAMPVRHGISDFLCLASVGSGPSRSLQLLRPKRVHGPNVPFPMTACFSWRKSIGFVKEAGKHPA
jgi:hypothetical protein